MSVSCVCVEVLEGFMGGSRILETGVVKTSAEGATNFKGAQGHAPPGYFEFLVIWNAISSIFGEVLREILWKYLVINNTILFEKWSTSQYLYSTSLSRMLFWPQTTIISASGQSPLYFFAILVDLLLPAGEHCQLRLQKTRFSDWG